ncbi:MAG TPA: MBL fold metallo-hydrolase [Blastocatellia bacterium]|nr:MBL fold metallo-hydrolase [Blastocatellia bacterium]
MFGKILTVLTFTCALCLSVTAQDAKSVLEATIKNMGDIKSAQYSGSGAQFNLGQSVSPDTPWPRTELKSFTRAVDYDKQASRNEAVGPQAPLATQFLAGDKAWGQGGANPTPASPAATTERQLQIWLTPHGFLKGALANKATVKRSGKATIVTFTALGKYRVVGTISADNLVEKVEARLDNAVLGDMIVESTYSDYRDFGGFKFPAKIVQKQGGHPVFDLTVTEAKANVALDLTVPDAVRQATTPAVQVTSEKLADGVWHLTGGSHHSVALEFADHVAVIEAPLNEDRSNAVIAEVKKLLPAKPLRYLINTHYHFDHSGGLRTYVAEGATIITHQSNQAFYETTFKAPHTLNPDRQWREKKKAKILAIGAKHVMSDSARAVELHLIQDNPHNSGIIMAWLPKERLLVEVDVYTPLPPNAPPPANPNPNMVNLYENIQRLNLDVNRIVPLHGRVVDLAELKKTIGK